MNNLTERFQAYMQELEERGIVESMHYIQDTPQERRGLQLGYNQSVVVLKIGVNIEHLRAFRSSTDAMGLKKEYAVSPFTNEGEDHKKSLVACLTERNLFEKYFPRNEFPEIYGTEETVVEDLERYYHTSIRPYVEDHAPVAAGLMGNLADIIEQNGELLRGFASSQRMAAKVRMMQRNPESVEIEDFREFEALLAQVNLAVKSGNRE